MSDGWETKRRRGAGHDWSIIQLGKPGQIHNLEVDTSWFKGNFPESCSLEAINAAGLAIESLTHRKPVGNLSCLAQDFWPIRDISLRKRFWTRVSFHMCASTSSLMAVSAGCAFMEDVSKGLQRPERISGCSSGERVS
jgi:hypothetical protein